MKIDSDNTMLEGNTMINSSKRMVWAGGTGYYIPNHIKTNSVTIVNNKVYIGGYELKENGEWKRTLRAFYYSFF